MAAAAGHENPDDWELVNDDGFVHKRLKRPRTDTTAATSSAVPPPPDPAVERKYLRERRKRALLKLRDKYLVEISRWELLSNTLREMEQSAAQAQSPERQDPCPTASFGGASSSEEHPAPDTTRRRVVDDLLSQVEAQEAIIQNVSNLCDLAERLCISQEERLKQQLTDLPIWEPSPNELMAVLGEQQ